MPKASSPIVVTQYEGGANRQSTTSLGSSQPHIGPTARAEHAGFASLYVTVVAGSACIARLTDTFIQQHLPGMKMRCLLVPILLACGMQYASAQSCPMPDDVLGRPLAEAKHVMSKTLGENWSPNLVGCGDGYINLMSNGQHANCKIAGRWSPEKIIILGFEGSGTVVGLVYVLGSPMSEHDVKKLFSRGTLRQIPDFPAPLRSVMPVPWGDVLFVSGDEGRVLRMGPEFGRSDRQIVQLFDLRAVEKEITPMQTCARETGTERDRGASPVEHTPDISAAPVSDTQSETKGYQALNLGRGIQLSVPGTWTIASDVQKDQIRADLKRYTSDDDDTAPLLFQTTSGPGWEVEAITINVKAPASFKPSDIRRVASQLPQALSSELERSTRELLQRVGCRLTKFEGTKVQEFSGYPTAVSSYEYARGTSRKRGRQMIVFTDTYEITITQSTPVARGDEAVARMDRIRDSIRIQ